MAARRVLLGGRYEIGPVIGSGGMAEVHRGRDVRIGRDVAIKLLRPDLGRDPTFLGRFQREAQAAASLNSPSIVAVYDTGEDMVGGQSTPYIVMEYVEGRTLRDVLAAEGRLLPRRALEITAAVCHALEQAHAAGIIHRDIKPGNVMLTPTGEVKVMDFGIARALSSTATMTQTAAVVGTAHYLSPEQARGEHVDARSDVYSTGCLLYELLTGAPPFTGDTAVAVAYQHVREDPVPPSAIESDVPETADAIVLVAMAKSPANRYSSAAEMRADIERALAGRPVHAVPLQRNAGLLGDVSPTTVLLREPPHRRHGPAYILLAVACVAVFTIVILVTRSLLGSNSNDLQTPDLVGLSLADAESTLASQGLTVGHLTYRYTKKDNKGQVVDEQPPAGILVKSTDPIDLVVSDGIHFVIVPSQLVGLSQQEAAAALAAADLKLGPVVQRNSNKPAGQVLETRPGPGANVPADTPVTLVISNSQVKVPPVVGQPVAMARAILVQAGFTVKVRTAAVYTKRNDGLVVTESPSAGSYLKGGLPVVIYVDRKELPASPTPSPSTTDTLSPTPSPSPTFP